MSNICKTASFRTENWRFWSEWRDSNSRHPGPKPGALPTGPHPDMKFKKNREVVKDVVKGILVHF